MPIPSFFNPNLVKHRGVVPGMLVCAAAGRLLRLRTRETVSVNWVLSRLFEPPSAVAGEPRTSKHRNCDWQHAGFPNFALLCFSGRISVFPGPIHVLLTSMPVAFGTQRGSPSNVRCRQLGVQSDSREQAGCLTWNWQLSFVLVPSCPVGCLLFFDIFWGKGFPYSTQKACPLFPMATEHLRFGGNP